MLDNNLLVTTNQISFQNRFHLQQPAALRTNQE